MLSNLQSDIKSEKSLNKVAITVSNLSKSYQIYEKPVDRLKQFVLPKLHNLFGLGSKSYFRDFSALNDVSFELNEGEAIGIIGRNGSGKSTLLQLICGTLTPSKGVVQTHGRVAALLELGSGFNQDFTGRENVYLNGAVLGLSKKEIDREFQNIVEFAEIGDFLDQPIKTYSSGMVVRLAFAVQAHLSPDILIVDEALAVGDIFFQQKCIRLMKNKLSYCTKIIVTHDMQTINNFCSRVIYLEDGRVKFIGDAKEGIEEYTRANHSRIFGDPKFSLDDIDVPTDNSSIDVSEQAYIYDIQPEVLGGRKSVLIQGFSISVNNSPCRSQSISIHAGDKVVIKMILFSKVNSCDLIGGYLLIDRSGMTICGDNTRSLDCNFSVLQHRRAELMMSFEWPAITDGVYTLTLGVGNGRDPMDHIIECWAHSVFAFESIARVPTHGLFTNHLTSALVKSSI